VVLRARAEDGVGLVEQDAGRVIVDSAGEHGRGDGLDRERGSDEQLEYLEGAALAALRLG